MSLSGTKRDAAEYLMMKHTGQTDPDNGRPTTTLKQFEDEWVIPFSHEIVNSKEWLNKYKNS